MIKGEITIRPRYGEVDQMGYVYHGNYVDYCHQARTELLRSIGINDKVLEDHGIMLPVIEMNLKYKQPVGYDEELKVCAAIKQLPETRLQFNFEFYKAGDKKVCEATTTVVFVDSNNRKPLRIPSIVSNALKIHFEDVSVA